MKYPITFDYLCKMLGVHSLDDYEQFVFSSGSYPSEWTEKDVEAAEKEAINKYIAVVVGVAEDLFGRHGLILVELKSKRLHYRVYPSYNGRSREKNWKRVCEMLIQTINGVGLFHYSSVQEFKASGPYSTYRQAAISHIGWIGSNPEVYEGRKASSMVDSRLR